MSKISVECPSCHATLKAPLEFASKVATCPHCRAKVRVPSDASVSPSTAQSAPAGSPPQRTPPASDPEIGLEDPLDIGTGAHDPFAEPVTPRASRTRRKQFPVDPKIVAAVAVAVILVGAGGYLFATRSSGAGEAMRYMPDNMAVMAVIRYSDIIDSQFTKTAKKELPQANNADKMAQKMVARQTGFSQKDLDKVDTVWLGATTDEDAVIYVEFNDDVSSTTVQEWFKGQEFKSTSVGGEKLYRSGKIAFSIVDSCTAVFGKPESLEKILGRDGEPKLAKGMNSALKAADMSQSVCVAMNLQAKGMENANVNFPGVNGSDKIMKSAESMVIQANIGSNLEFGVFVVCGSSAAAQELQKAAETGLANVQGMAQMVMGPAGKDVFDRIKVSASGSTTSITADIDVELLEKVGENIKNAKPPTFPVGS